MRCKAPPSHHSTVSVQVSTVDDIGNYFSKTIEFSPGAKYLYSIQFYLILYIIFYYLILIDKGICQKVSITFCFHLIYWHICEDNQNEILSLNKLLDENL